MSLVLLMSLTLGRRDGRRWGPSANDATLGYLTGQNQISRLSA